MPKPVRAPPAAPPCPDWWRDGHTSTTIPTVPSSVPAHPRQFGGSPPGNAHSINATIIGSVDTSSDAKPLGTMVSPHVSSMLLPLINSSPTTASFQPSPRGTRRLLPRTRAIVTINTVVSMDRVAETTGGGRCSPATRIAVYVEPQHRYTAANAANTRVPFSLRMAIMPSIAARETQTAVRHLRYHRPMRIFAASLWLPLLATPQTQTVVPQAPATNPGSTSTFRSDALHLSYAYPTGFKDATTMAAIAFQVSLSGDPTYGSQAKCISLPFARMSPSTQDFGMVILIRADAGCLKKKFNAGSVEEFAKGEAQGLAFVGAKTSFGPPVAFELAARPATLEEGSFTLPTGQNLQAMVVCVLDQPDIACWQFLAASADRLHSLAALPVTFDGSPATPIAPAPPGNAGPRK